MSKSFIPQYTYSQTEQSRLHLLRPFDLLATYQLNQSVAHQVHLASNNFQQAFLALQLKTPTQAIRLVDLALQQLNPINATPVPEDFSTKTSLKRVFAQGIDQYMEVQHVESEEPSKVIVAGILTAFLSFLKLRQQHLSFDPIEAERLEIGFESYINLLVRSCNLNGNEQFSKRVAQSPMSESKALPHSTTPQVFLEENIKTNTTVSTHIDSLKTWRQGHWIFYVFVQGLILCLRRLFVAVQFDDLKIAKLELDTATQFLWASGAAMKLASNFQQEAYEQEVRPTMTLGHAKALVTTEFSGLMSWDHHYLINIIWKQELAQFVKTMPVALYDAHEKFVQAYRDGLSLGHIGVCAKFGGREASSLLSSKTLAVDFLKNIRENRLRRIDPHYQKATSKS